MYRAASKKHCVHPYLREAKKHRTLHLSMKDFEVRELKPNMRRAQRVPYPARRSVNHRSNGYTPRDRGDEIRSPSFEPWY